MEMGRRHGSEGNKGLFCGWMWGRGVGVASALNLDGYKAWWDVGCER